MIDLKLFGGFDFGQTDGQTDRQTNRERETERERETDVNIYIYIGRERQRGTERVRILCLKSMDRVSLYFLFKI